MRRWYFVILVLFSLGSPALAEDSAGLQLLFNGKDLSGWDFLNCKAEDWSIQNGILSTVKGPTRTNAFLMTEGQFDDFELRLEYQLTKGADTGVAIRSAPVGGPHSSGIVIQLIDDAA